jgi:DNA-binding XRE family transcriptional regulator
VILRTNLLEILRGSRTQTEMSNRFNVSQQTWSSWEVGRTLPDHETMLKMEFDFDVPMEVIFFNNFNYKLKLKSKVNQDEDDQAATLCKTG